MSKKFLIFLFTFIAGILLVLFLSQNRSENINQSNLPNAKDLLINMSGSKIDISRIDSDLIPPTNSWLSGAVLQNEPQPIYPMPLSIKLQDDSIELGLPRLDIEPGLITAPHLPNSIITFSESLNYKLTRYDKLSATVTYYEENEESFNVTFAEGSPYIFIESIKDISFSLNTIENIEFEVHSGAIVTESTNNISNIDIPAKGLLTLFPDLENSEYNNKLAELSSNKIEKVEHGYSVHDDSIETTIYFKTYNQPSVYFSLPHQNIKEGNETYQAVYTGLYGDMDMYIGNNFSFSSAKYQASNSLDLDNIDDEERELLKEALVNDIKEVKFEADDTYFGGKELYKAANLLKVSRQLGEEKLSRDLEIEIKREMTIWFDDDSSRYFYYDNEVRGVVGENASFGSEDFNDHHFHYGYFIYTATILAENDPDFLEKYQDKVTLLALDIANYDHNLGTAPLYRNFDPYKSHSWASGSSPFADGNNQESSSEAINAWNSVVLWSEVIGDTIMNESATWMLNAEIQATKTYWFDEENRFKDTNYNKPIFSLNWGGKREYATFFSNHDSSILGIQFIPMPPVMKNYTISIEKLDEIVQIFDANEYQGQFSDYALMQSSSYTEINPLLEKAKNIETEYIDTANSRTYMYAWIISDRT